MPEGVRLPCLVFKFFESVVAWSRLLYQSTPCEPRCFASCAFLHTCVEREPAPLSEVSLPLLLLFPCSSALCSASAVEINTYIAISRYLTRLQYTALCTHANEEPPFRFW